MFRRFWRKAPLHVATPHPCREKLKEDRKKLMESFQAILSLQLGSTIAAIIGIAGLGLMNENFQSVMIVALLITALIASLSLTFTYTVKVKESLSCISTMTCLVTILCAGTFHLAIFLITLKDNVYTLLHIIIFSVEYLLIVFAWDSHFPIP